VRWTLMAFCVVLSVAELPPPRNDCLPLKVRNPEGNYIVPGVQGEIVYRRVDGRDVALDAYVQKRRPTRPAVIVIHGGGWTSGSRVAYVGQFLELLTRAGFNWFSIDYRLSRAAKASKPAMDDALEDAKAALAFVRCHAGEFRIDPARIALLGEDTGADLAAAVAADPKMRVQAAVLIGGGYQPAARKAGSTPILIIHGTADSESPPDRAKTFCDSLTKAGGRCDFVPVEGGIHRAENWRPAQWTYKPRLVEWLARALSLAAADHEPYRTRLQKDIVYGDGGFELLLDAYVPPGAGPFPAVIIAHGGGWEAGDKVTYVTPAFEPLARAGYAWFSIDYRLTPAVPHEAQLDDLRRAVHFVRSNAKKLKIDPRRVAILGESASGQMVAQVAAEGLDVAAVVSFYGVYDFSAMVTDAGPRSLLVRLFRRHTLDEEARGVLRQFSPLHRATAQMPPMLMIHGTNERLWAQALAMQKRLTEIGARHDLYGIEGAPHGMENWEGHPEWLGYKEKLVDWLRRTLQ
jgi:acetyl esterase